MMKIFLSYASEDRSVAEDITTSLRNRGHDVFFDRTDLPSADTYEDRIEEAILKASLFVFLISPRSVAQGKFTLTELSIARKKWPVAKRRVLPVIIEETAVAEIPVYLRSVSFLEPDGNVAAEVALAVDGMRTSLRDLARRAVLPLSGVTLIAAAAYVFWPVPVEFDIETTSPAPFEAGFFGEPDTYNVIIRAMNSGTLGAEVMRTSFEIEPANELTIHPKEPRASEIVPPGSTYVDHRLISGENANARYRACVHFSETNPKCSQWKDWKTEGHVLYGDAFEIAPSIRDNAVAVGWDTEGFLIATETPDQLIRLNENGDILTQVNLPGRPLSISSSALGLYLGIAGPNAVLRLDPSSLEILAQLEVDFPFADPVFGGAVSDQPASIAQDGENLWVLTRGSASASGLLYANNSLEAFTVPEYYEEISFDLKDMNLRDGEGYVWSGQTDTIPASVYGFSTNDIRKYGGHDFDIASCASDTMSIAPQELIIPDCSGNVWRVEVTEDQIDQISRIDSILGYNSTPTTTETVLLGLSASNEYIGVLSQDVRDDALVTTDQKISVSSLDWSAGAKLIFSLRGAKVLDVVGGETTFLILLESLDGQRQLVAPYYQSP